MVNIAENNSLNRLDVAGYGWNGLKWLELAGTYWNGWKLPEIAGMAGID